MWRFVIPSMLTCTGIVVGFASIVESAAGHTDSAAWLILICVLLDKLDGSAARVLKGSSRFGIELDSLSDLITFGLAPAVLVTCAVGNTHQLLPQPYAAYLTRGCAALYVVAAALRLAKFNVITRPGDRYFFGIPTTVVGGLLCCYYLTVRKYQLDPMFVRVLPLILLFLALLMVSRIPLRKPALTPWRPLNGLIIVNVVCVFICPVLRILPEYLLTVGGSYVVVGATWSTLAGVRPPARDTTA